MTKYLLYSKLFLHLYEFRVWNMKRLLSILLLFAVYTGNPLSVNAQQGGTEHTSKQAQISVPDSTDITAYDNKIIVKNAPIGSLLEIYSVVGIRVKEIDLKQANGEYPVNIAKGYYIVRIDNTVRKIAIR